METQWPERQTAYPTHRGRTPNVPPPRPRKFEYQPDFAGFFWRFDRLRDDPLRGDRLRRDPLRGDRLRDA
jgi:hypothetical protein